VPRRGYRFISPVKVSRREAPQSHDERRDRRGSGGRTAAALWLGLAGGILVAHLAEASPWHDRVVQWIHLRFGTLPVVCDRP
jgi:hypothetical protein